MQWNRREGQTSVKGKGLMGRGYDKNGKEGVMGREL